MANQNRMKIEEAAGVAFDQLLTYIRGGTENRMESKVVTIEGHPFVVTVSAPKDSLHFELKPPPWADVHEGAIVGMPGGGEHPAAMGIHQQPEKGES